MTNHVNLAVIYYSATGTGTSKQWHGQAGAGRIRRLKSITRGTDFNGRQRPHRWARQERSSQWGE